ncbi:MAG: hypothetical protein ACI4JQ_03460 [Ruminococcus sp.]
MIIKKLAIGNSEEAFVEKSFTDRLNIISSDDNNKGKTIVIQSLMYALGNEPTFPTSFDYQKYYHYVEFEVESTIYKICRHAHGIVLKHGTTLMIFDNVSELKRYWTKHIFRLPIITKNQIQKIVDPVLFFQLFFVGQDKKDTSNISHPGLYNKQDFYSMLYDFCNIGGVEFDDKEVQQIKEKIKKLNQDKSLLLREFEVLKSSNSPISYLSSINDKINFEKKLIKLEGNRKKIEELKKDRNRTATLKSKWETTLKELQSLNRTINCGELRCMDCNSTNIAFSSSDKKSYSFDVSTTEMRKEIIESIIEKIKSYGEEIERLSYEIAKTQMELQTMMDDDEVSLEAIVAYKQEIFSASDAERKIKSIDDHISTLSSQLKITTDRSKSKKLQRESILNSIITKMNETYHKIDSNSNQEITDLFTKRYEVYSGSEATIFHLVKLYSIREVTQHHYPIIIDSFRAEDLSTQKETIVLDLFKKFDNQIILTTTLKKQELGKYDNMQGINHIDYKHHVPSKILSKDYLQEFISLIGSISLKITQQ